MVFGYNNISKVYCGTHLIHVVKKGSCIIYSDLLMNFQRPIISPGEYQPQGTILTVTHGIWNKPALTYSYQWQRNGINISGATQFSYTIQGADVGTILTCIVSVVGQMISAISINSVNAIALPNFFVDNTINSGDSNIIKADKY